jgi:zinc D-Ala-D-Ala dipeptidase
MLRKLTYFSDPINPGKSSMQYPDYKVKILDWTSNAGDYGRVPFDFDDPRSHEPLVSVTERGIAAESYYARTDGLNWPYNARIDGSLKDVWCRRGVAEKLLNVNSRLKPYDVELFVLDAYRAIDVQRGLWAFFEAEARRKMPHRSAEEIRNYILQFVSDPTRFNRDDPTTWPVHSSGGAVDLTLRHVDGDLLDMGARFDEPSAASFSDALERLALKGVLSSDDAALKNRRLLHWAMEQEGFVNYPLEFWHFDFGDQMYVHHLALLGVNAPVAAWYGTIDPPTMSGE